MTDVSAPVLSKKKQNKSVANKKKALKSVRNIITAPEAIFWPVLKGDVEKSEIVKLLKSLAKPIDLKTEKRAVVKNVDVKFGVNEISRRIVENDCKAILLETAVPRILVLHLLSLATVKKIPILCLDVLSSTISDCFGFKSSSVCFTSSSDPIVLKICDAIATNCMKYYKTAYEETKCAENQVLNESKREESTALAPADVEKEESSKSSKDPLDFLQFSKDTKKRKLIFQPLLIKRVCTNPHKKNKK